MRSPHTRLLTALILTIPTAFAQSELPWGNEETLYYEVNWPSGLSLGEASMTAGIEAGATDAEARRRFELTIHASIPGFLVDDTIRASASGGLCSLELEKDLTHGAEHLREKTTFDHASGTATRASLDGPGVSEIATGECPKDALTFLYDLRSQLARGRIPSAQTVYFGAGYEVSIEHVGRETVDLGGEAVEGDRLRATVVGPGSRHEIEMLIARDASRRPIWFRVSLELGEFSMQLLP